MLAASPALFPSAASAKPQQNNPAPVTEGEGGKQTESQRQNEGGPGVEKKKKKIREVQFCRVTSGSYVMQVFSFCLPHPGF